MSKEFSVRGSLSVRWGDNLLQYGSTPTAFDADLAAASAKGPTPGAVTVGTSRTSIDLSQLTSPGFAWLQNTDAANRVHVGLYLDWLSLFVPFLELGPGRFAVVELSRYLGEDLVDSAGTGTADAHAPQLAMKAENAPCVVRVDCFER